MVFVWCQQALDKDSIMTEIVPYLSMPVHGPSPRAPIAEIVNTVPYKLKSGNHGKTLSNMPPHLLRHLNCLNEKYKNAKWGNGFKILLPTAMGSDKDRPVEKGNTERAGIVQRPERLLESPPGQQCLGTRHSKCEGQTENIGAVQNRDTGTELRQDTYGNRYHHQKRHERFGGLDTYR